MIQVLLHLPQNYSGKKQGGRCELLLPPAGDFSDSISVPSTLVTWSQSTPGHGTGVRVT